MFNTSVAPGRFPNSANKGIHEFFTIGFVEQGQDLLLGRVAQLDLVNVMHRQDSDDTSAPSQEDDNDSPKQDFGRAKQE